MIQNMRDLGGIRTKDGKIVRKGMLIRSAQLNQAEAEDLDGISAVIDLRTPEERNESPDQTYGREYLPLPIFEERTFGISHEQGADTQGIPDMAVLYGILMKQCAGSFGKVLRTIMEHDFSKGAVLWHCSEGTGKILRTPYTGHVLRMKDISVPRGTPWETTILPGRSGSRKTSWTLSGKRRWRTAEAGKTAADEEKQKRWISSGRV